MRKPLLILLGAHVLLAGVFLAWRASRPRPAPKAAAEQQPEGGAVSGQPSRRRARKAAGASARQPPLLRAAPDVALPPPPTAFPGAKDDVEGAEETAASETETAAPDSAAPPAAIAAAGRTPGEETEEEDGPTTPPEPRFGTIMKAAARETREKLVEQSYGALFEQLDLTDEELGRLKKMLLLTPHISGRPAATTPAGAETTPAQPNLPTTPTVALENALRSLLGQERYEVYQDYSTTLPGRWLVRQYDRHLTSLGTPLTEDQQGQLLSIVVEERQDLPSVSATSALQDLPGVVDRMAASLEAQQKSSAAILARAGTLLDGQQLAGLRDLEEGRAERQQRSLEVYRQLLKTGGQDVPSTQ